MPHRIILARSVVLLKGVNGSDKGIEVIVTILVGGDFSLLQKVLQKVVEIGLPCGHLKALFTDIHGDCLLFKVRFIATDLLLHIVDFLFQAVDFVLK